MFIDYLGEHASFLDVVIIIDNFDEFVSFIGLNSTEYLLVDVVIELCPGVGC